MPASGLFSDMIESAMKAEKQMGKMLPTDPPPRSPWPGIVLALWVLWLLALACMSRNEWTRERPTHHEPATDAAERMEPPAAPRHRLPPLRTSWEVEP
jgi:hypothetical protein